ncbi:MAG: hypothetical protein ABIN94_13255 [Ferruginibacter sp.]
MSTNFHLAPPAKMVDGLTAVPADIQTIDAILIFDAATSTASADATIHFITGPQNGKPIFDLRQTITAAWLNGVSIPVSQIAHHDFGGGADAELRIIDAMLPANTAHSLRVTYIMGIPNASTAGSYQPHFSWSAGPRLVFNFGFTDLGAGRYLEAWIPANLIFDQFTLNLEIQLINTTVQHSLITNGSVTNIANNHWSITYPTRFTALSFLLELRATDTLAAQIGTVTLPVSGNTVTIEAYKLSSDAANLTTQINNIKTFLTENENNYGAYIHGNRFVVFLLGGGMEYEGGITGGAGAVRHETFHSWFARGLKPASQPDSWWDEAFTTYHDAGASSSMPFDFTSSPKVLCTQNAWSRITPSTTPNAYIDGERFWKGVSAAIGNSNLRALMKSFYNDKFASLIRTTDIEEYLVAKSGNALLVDGFHRFVYGFNDPSPAPDIWLRDQAGDPGDDYWGGSFWNSPDLWIRNNDDGGTAHQNPEYGQDNWFYARVRNKSSGLAVKHFLVSFNAKSFAGTEFLYPNDFLPAINAATGFDLPAGSSTIVKARWPAADVPTAGTHSCVLAAIIARSAHPISGRHVWEHNNLAQKNLTIVDLVAGDFIILPFLISNLWYNATRKFTIEIRKGKSFPANALAIIHQPSLFKRYQQLHSIPLYRYFKLPQTAGDLLDCAGHGQPSNQNEGAMITQKNIGSFVYANKEAVISELHGSKIPALITTLKPRDQAWIAMKVAVPKDSKPGIIQRFDFIQRDSQTNKIIGGVALEIRVKETRY